MMPDEFIHIFSEKGLTGVMEASTDMPALASTHAIASPLITTGSGSITNVVEMSTKENHQREEHEEETIKSSF